jgi:hypothetical protein
MFESPYLCEMNVIFYKRERKNHFIKCGKAYLIKEHPMREITPMVVVEQVNNDSLKGKKHK